MTQEKRWKSLDEAIEEINRNKLAKQPKVPKSQVDDTSRWWSYTSASNNISEGEAVQHCACSHEIGVDTSKGIQYQKCGGGRRVIHKHLRGN